MVSQNEIDKLFGQGRLELERQNEAQKLATIKTVDICGSVYWTPFYEKYPEAWGYYRLSRVGFSRTFAMVMVEREDVCGGFSRTYILKKTHGKWKIVTWMGTEWVRIACRIKNAVPSLHPYFPKLLFSKCPIQPKICQLFLDAVCPQAFVEILEVDKIEMLILVKARENKEFFARVRVDVPL